MARLVPSLVRHTLSSADKAEQHIASAPSPKQPNHRNTKDIHPLARCRVSQRSPGPLPPHYARLVGTFQPLGSLNPFDNGMVFHEHVLVTLGE